MFTKYISGIPNPPSLILLITVSLLTLGVLLSQRKENISLSSFYRIYSGTNRTENKKVIRDIVKDFRIVTLPFSDQSLPILGHRNTHGGA